MTKNNIKILHILEAAGGGVSRHISELACRVAKDKYNIVIVATTRRSKTFQFKIEKMENAGIRVLLLHMRKTLHPWYDALAFCAILSIVRKEKPDIVHTHSSKAGLLGRLAAFFFPGITSIYTPHCFYFIALTGLHKHFSHRI